MGEGLRDARRDRLLGEHGRDALVAGELRELAEARRVGLGVGRQAGDALLPEPVAVREVAERLVRGDEQVAGATGQALAVPRVERGEPVLEGLRVLLVRGGALRIGGGEPALHLADELRHEDRVEPHVRVEPAGLPLLGDLLAPGVDELGQELDRRSVAPVGCLLHRGLEIVPEHERNLRFEQPVELLRVQLEVVRFGARSG